MKAAATHRQIPDAPSHRDGYHGAQPPYIDCGDEEEIPFYNSEIDNETAVARVIDFDDAPGLTIAPLFNPDVMDAVKASQVSPSTYALVGTEGENHFVAAVVAYSEHIKNTYVVLAKMHWKLNVKSVVQTNVDSNTPFGVTCTCTPQTGSGTSWVNEEIPQLPLEASAAGIETYGPTAVSGGEDSSDDDETDYAKYLWQQT